MVERENVLNSGHLIHCGYTNKDDANINLFAMCLYVTLIHFFLLTVSLILGNVANLISGFLLASEVYSYTQQNRLELFLRGVNVAPTSIL